jgi:hypothetical protein
MDAHRVVSIQIGRMRPANHAVVVSVRTANEAPEPRDWSLKDVLSAMNRAVRFYSEAPNGRQARVQRFQCERCKSDHIRTHISDRAIHDLANLPQR